MFDHVFNFGGADTSFPLFVFVFLVALGIDYNIFLMTRVREEAGKRGPRRGALAGLSATGGVITSAGAVLAGTFAALAVLAGVAQSLGLDAGYFATGYTADPTILFRIFHYPPSLPQAGGWGVGEHTDYGLVTLLAQDDSGGLQIAAPEGWIDAPPVPGTLVCNIGDMLDRLTGGWYRSTPHRVRNLSGHGRLSFPFFLDPGFAAEVPPLPDRAAAGDDGRRRWDGQDLRAFTGSYGDYLLGKVSKVFPQLRSDVLG